VLALPIAHNLPLACPAFRDSCSRVRALCSPHHTSRGTVQADPGTSGDAPQGCAALLVGLINDPAIGKYDLSSLRVVQSGGSASAESGSEPSSSSERYVQENFGMGEGMLFFVRLEIRRTFVWKPAAGRCVPTTRSRLIDEDGREVPDGEVGELCCAAPIMQGYFRCA